MEEFRKELKRKREEKGIKMVELSLKIGRSTAYISQVESGIIKNVPEKSRKLIMKTLEEWK